MALVQRAARKGLPREEIRMITLEDYFGPYWDQRTPELEANAVELLARCNRLYAMAQADGCELPLNPKTRTGVSGRTDGGFRPQDSHTGAPNSTHKTGQGVDRYDPLRRLAAWILAHQDKLNECDLHMEDPRWTPGWVHLQTTPPRSKKRIYIPNENNPLADYPEPWTSGF